MRRVAIWMLSLAFTAVFGGMSHTQVFGGDTGTIAQALISAQPDGWRYVYENNCWWYYHPNNTWSFWNGSSWAPYGYTTGYRGYSLNGTWPNPQWYGGRGFYGWPVGATYRGKNISAVDALPGEANPQMVGGGLGHYGYGQ